MRVSWRAVRSAAAVQAVQCVDDHAASFQSGSIPLDPGTPVSSRDRDFRPSRRRGFDDDNFETPRRGFGSTPGSSAQRFEAPAGPPVQAVVKWYNPDKGFGFVQLADGSGDAFLHTSVVERSGHGCAYRLCRPNVVPMETAEPSDRRDTPTVCAGRWSGVSLSSARCVRTPL